MTAQEIQDLLDKLFAIAGAAASQGWALAYRQVYVTVAQEAIGFLFMLFVIWLGWKLLAIAKKKENEDNSIEVVGAWTCLLVGGIALPVLFTEIVARLVNPGWYAVQLLLRTVR